MCYPHGISSLRWSALPSDTGSEAPKADSVLQSCSFLLPALFHTVDIHDEQGLQNGAAAQNSLVARQSQVSWPLFLMRGTSFHLMRGIPLLSSAWHQLMTKHQQASWAETCDWRMPVYRSGLPPFGAFLKIAINSVTRITTTW